MKKELLDIILNGQSFGTVGQRLLANGMSAGALRPYIGDDGRAYITVNGEAVPTLNATLRKDEWKHYDTAVVDIARQRLVAVQDLISRGLTYNIPNGLGTTVMEYEDAGDIEAAQISMDGLTKGQNDAVEYQMKYLPLPIIHKDFFINARVLAASRTGNRPMDTTLAQMASRKVADKLENILVNGTSSYAYAGGTIYGYLDFPYVATYTLQAHWNDTPSSGTGQNCVEDVIAMKQKSIDNLHYGPWMVYVSTNYETVLDGDFKANGNQTIRQRIMAIEGILGVKVLDVLPADRVVLVEMNPTTVRMVNALPLSVVEWQEQGGMVSLFKVMTIQVPQIRADQNNKCGIVVGSGA